MGTVIRNDAFKKRKTIILIGLDFEEFELKNFSLVESNGISIAHHKFQNYIYQGLIKYSGEYDIKKISSLPVSYHLNKNAIIFPNIDAEYYHKIGFINIPYLKHELRRINLYQCVKRIIKKNGNDVTLLIYDIYLPIIKASIKLKNKYGLKVVVIFPDLPGKYCIEYSSYKWYTKIIKNLEQVKLFNIAKQLDGAIVLTKQMSEIMGIPSNKTLVLEAITENVDDIEDVKINDHNKVVFLYSGELSKTVSIDVLIEAFKCIDLKKAELWICGNGEMEEYIISELNSNDRIHFFGYLVGEEFEKIVNQADILVNPRQNNNLYTRYSFPSKNIEYIRTGKPVIAYKLDGIPDEYDDIIFYPLDNGISSLSKLMEKVALLSNEEKIKLRSKEINFINNHKSKDKQVARIIEFLNKV